MTEQQAGRQITWASDGSHTEGLVAWLHLVDDWSIAGRTNQIPRFYYLAAGLLMLTFLI